LPASAGFTIYEEEEEEKTASDVYRDPGGRESQGVESERYCNHSRLQVYLEEAKKARHSDVAEILEE
jgi:hypothetical protein